jgi:outer membrane protein assembly factor BamB
MNRPLSPRLVLACAVVVLLPAFAIAGDWPDWRGPNRNGVSLEKNLPEKWSLAGENLAWKAPYGGRSAPIILGDRLYLQNTAESGVTEQERLICFNADTGEKLWEQRFNMFQSDVPAHRIAWASPVADSETGNVYVFGGNNLLTALSRDGKKVWERSINEEFSPFTTHGGRTVSPVIDGNLVIVSTPTSTWGTQANRAQRFIALDKKTGDIIWVSTPGGRPYDTSYAPMNIVTVNGTRLLVTGGSDGAALAMKAQTGEPVWKLVAAKRGLNTGIVVNGNMAILSHSEENLSGNNMGMLAAFDATATGELGKDHIKWQVTEFMGGFSSPVIDGDRLYQIDNGATLVSFDVQTGRELWRQSLGTIQKASAVFGDGKIYAGTENGKFFILRPHADRCEVLSEVDLPISNQGLTTQQVPEPVVAGAAIARGRVYFVSSDTLYAIGPKKTSDGPWKPVKPVLEPGQGEPAWVQVAPTELVLKPGDAVQLHARLYDKQGRFLREEKADWTLEGLQGTVEGGKFTVAKAPTGQAGLIKATVGGVKGEARARVIPPLPWEETFDSYPVGSVPAHWVSATTGRFQVSELDGQKVLEKPPLETLFKRMRVFMGPSDWSNYTVEADIRLNEKRRQMGDAGITAQRYTLFAFGNSQRLEMNSWQPETARAAAAPFPWKPNTWYRLKLRVENTADGKTRIRGKAWPAGEPEPEAWPIDRVDPIPNQHGSPGIFADAQFGAYFDNLKVYPNP